MALVKEVFNEQKRRSNTTFIVPIGLRREPLGRSVPGLFTGRSHGCCAHVGVLGRLNLEVMRVISEIEEPDFV